MRKKTVPRLPTRTADVKNLQRMVKIAERYAENAAFALAMGHSVPDDWHQFMEGLAKLSAHYNEKAWSEADGDVQCACYDAGVAIGIAFGLRMCGPRFHSA